VIGVTVGSANIIVLVGAVVIVSAALSAGLIALLLPHLRNLLLVRPGERSSHRNPTPQGGGLAVVVAVLATSWTAMAAIPFARDDGVLLLALTASASLLAILGAIDDLRNLNVWSRVVVQCVALAIVIAALPAEVRVVTALPWHLERLCLLLGGLWFLNLVNFMDGIDWMMVAEVVPITAAIVLLGSLEIISVLPMLVAAALLGAMLGFAPFNKPVARLFLGDVGSLPIALMLGGLLLLLASQGHVAAAILLPLYFLADASVTLLRRIVRREPFWRAHRTHFYQKALERGFSVPDVIVRVFITNLALVGLAVISIVYQSVPVSLACLGVGIALVGFMLMRFARGRG
jgi:UDP-N-acetylmuramyl pentapeptide phosphotransferase/UDP-N-acetylglucosamine-1-phosphate transferase